MIGYTGPVRRGHSLRPSASNGATVASITQPCPTCGEDAIAQTYDSMRPDGVYRVTQLRCPSAQTRRSLLHPKKKITTCPIHKTEIKIGDDPMPVQKICTVIPRPEDQAEYKRLKAVLGLENQEFVKLCLLTNSPVYDWFAGRAISPQTEAKILHAIKALQKREGKPVVKASNGSQIADASKEAAPAEPKTETQSNSRECDCAGCVTCGSCSACEPETGCGDCNPKRPWEVSKERLQKYTNGNGSDVEPTVSFSAAAVENAEKRLTNLHTRIGAMDVRLTIAENEINALARSVSHIEDEMDAEPEITDEQLERIQFEPNHNHAAKAHLAVELMTSLPPLLVQCVWEVIQANKQLAQALAQ